jgi:CRP-like cAMP-binding protein/cytochrome c peroxidase
MFGIAAFTAFVAFYSFAGQPTLRKVEWLPGITSVLIVLTASLFLVRRLTRTPQAFAEQSIARNIIKRWEWSDTRPPTDLHDAVVMHTARVSERDRAYAQVLEAYQEAVRETVATGLVTRQEVQRLEALRNQLQIKRADHERVMAALAEDERAMLSDPLQQPSAEQRLQLESYAQALSNYLERTPGVVGSDERFIQQLRHEFRVSPEQHQAILSRLLETGEAEGTLTRITDDVRSIEDASRSIAALAATSSPSAAYFVDLLQRLRHRTAQRLVHGAGSTLDTPSVTQLVAWLESSEEPNRKVAIGALCNQLPGAPAEHLQSAYTEAAAKPTFADIPDAYASHPDPYIRSAAQYLLAERDGVRALDRITPSLEDEHELVRSTASGLQRRLSEPQALDGMLAIEKMIALRRVPIFAALGPIELEELARSSTDRVYTRNDPLCLAGDVGGEVFVVLRGTVVVVDGKTRDSPLIRVETTGSVIGEMAVLDAAPRSASAFAGESDAHVLCLDGDAFRFALNSDPRVAEGVMRTLARRIRSREVSDAVPTTHSPEHVRAGGLTVLSVLAFSAALAASVLLGGTTVAAAPAKSHACDGCPSIFRAFSDADGMVRSAPIDSSLDATNAFFAEDLGKNAQACYDCHQPRQGFSLQVPFIQSTFDSSAGTDSIFALNDTATRPDADISTIEKKQTVFSLFLNLGLVRIGKTHAAGDFTVIPQTTDTFGQEPKPSCATNDPLQTTDCDSQGLGGPPTLSVFRRPLVNTNVFFDSAVLFDGRASIANMNGQVKKAAQTLLLSETCDVPTSPTPCTPTLNAAQEQDIARFMTGVFTAQEGGTTVGQFHAAGASGGIADLVALARNPLQPCRTAAGVNTPFTPSTCTPAASPTMTLFDAWNGSPVPARAAIARGQALFNGGAHLNGMAGVTSCSSCHALNNLGNSPSDTSPLSFVRLGLDSPDFLSKVASEDTRLASFVSRTSGLPLYEVTQTTAPTCPTLNDPATSSAVTGTNMRSSDPGRALVTGKCADLGAFKPPLLRNLAVRAPYFHNAAAASLDDVVNFYNVKFQIGLSAQQHSDLVAFLKAL